MFNVLLQQALLWNLWDVKLLKASVKMGLAADLRFHPCHWRSTDSWLHYPQHFTHDLFQRDFKKKSHFKEPINFIVVAQWKWPLLKYRRTLGPYISNSINRQMRHQNAVGSWKSLAWLWLLFKDSNVCTHMQHVGWLYPPGLWSTVTMSPADRIRTIKLDLNRLWHHGLGQH